jgi:starch phosphorylase
VLSSIGSSAIASNITHHAEFTPLFSPEHSSPLKAYHATARSVFDALIMNWNATYDYYNKVNVKQAYYLSMEFLQVSQSTSFSLISYLLVTEL